MIFLGWEEIDEGHDSDFVFVSDFFVQVIRDEVTLLLAVGVDAGTVLMTDIVPLTVDAIGVHETEEMLQDFRQGKDGVIIDKTQRLCVVCPSLLQVLVCRVLG